MEAKVIVSKKFSLQWRDVLRGAFMAAGTAAAVVLQTSLDAGELEFKWKQMGMAGLGAGLLYLFKNLLLEPAKVITTTNNDHVEQVQEDIKDVL